MRANPCCNQCWLNKVKTQEGAERCKAVFQEACRNNRRSAANLLNHPCMTFPCLFLLLPQVKAHCLSSCLSRRNRIAMGIADQIQNPSNTGSQGAYLSVQTGEVHSVLRWMLTTGIAEDSLQDDYNQILDITVSVLIHTYRDKSILPLVDDLIFRRGKSGRNVHGLVWSFFQLKDPCALKLMAEHIRSQDRGEAQLACRLLNIDAPQEPEDNQSLYESFLHWLGENDPFLYFTNESMQFSSKPTICKVHLERKYMHKPTPSYIKQPLTPSDNNEKERLSNFQELDREDQKALCECSHQLRRKDYAAWQAWLASPMEEQIRSAKWEEEGER